MMIFKKKKFRDRVEERFNLAINLVKDLDKPEFRRLMDGLESTWRGYDIIRKTKTITEKEMKEITDAENILSNDK